MARGKLGKAAKKFSKEVLEEAAERTRKADIADAVNDVITAKTGASIHKPTMSEHAEAAKGLLTAEEVSAQAKLNAPEMRRKRRLEIENNPNSSPEARAKATAQLDAKKSKPETAAEYKQREADRINNSEAGKNYREKQKELEYQARQAEYEKNRPKEPASEARRKRRLEIENNPNASPEARSKATSALDKTSGQKMTQEEWKAKEQARKENSQAGKDYRQRQKELERQAKQAEYEKNKPSKPSKQDIEDVRRYRREEIRDNGKTEAARNKAKEDLKRQPQEEAQQVDRTMTREQYKKQRSEERKKTRSFNEQEDGQLSLFDMGTSEPNTTSEYIARETTGLDGKKHTVFDENKNYKSPEPEYKTRETTGLDSEKHTVYDEVKQQESQVKNQDTLKVNKKTNEVDTAANVDRQAREARVNEVNELNNGNKMERRSLGTWASEIISGTGDETHRISGRKTRAANMAKANADINAANQTYIDTGKGSAQQLYNKNSYWAKVSGEGKKTPDKFNQNDWEDLGKMQNQASAPEDVASQNSKKGLDWDGIAGWVKENQIVTAAGIAGTALIGASLLDDE